MLDANTDFRDRNLAGNEEAIEKAINYLKHTDPANANREYAAGLLKFMQGAAKEAASVSPLSFEEYVARYNASLKFKKEK
jgi:predicted metal-dependent hydrolase